MNAGFYSELESFANYGPMYRRIQKCYLAAGTFGVDVLTEVHAWDEDIPKYSIGFLPTITGY